ncbi:hemin uptake protein HemP [Thauera sp. WH-1]|uniref:hemin uptake protein HemP n=1 Tax=Thauera sp. WH-1 TaxID=3398230 RepID=UPI0039FBD151
MAHGRTASAPAPAQVEYGPPSGQPPRPGADALVRSEALFAGRSTLTIEHEGTHYVLRATRSGKLILTK